MLQLRVYGNNLLPYLAYMKLFSPLNVLNLDEQVYEKYVFFNYFHKHYKNRKQIHNIL